MNFLAHLHLSGKNEELRIGNFIGDFVKGSELDQFSVTIQNGIQLHRAIDEFTDSHAIVKASKNRLRQKYRHYSAVIVDIYYDHYLALNWHKFHPKQLRKYVDEQYDMLLSHKNFLPLKAQQMLPYMIKNDWLFNYQYYEGIERVMQGMAGRSRFNSKMEQSVVELKKYHHDFEQEFLLFYPSLVEFSESFISSLNII